MLSYGPQVKLPNNLTYKLRPSGQEVINNACVCPHSDMTSLGDITDREGPILSKCHNHRGTPLFTPYTWGIPLPSPYPPPIYDILTVKKGG